MKLVITLFTVFLYTATRAQVADERTISFDDGWKFLRADDSTAFMQDYSDNNWRAVDLPHDWSIEDLPNQNTDSVRGPFLKSSVGGQSTGYVAGGVGWYRKTFTLPAAARHKLVSVYFDGVYMNSDVWINGHHLGNHPYGYTPFYYDLTPWLSPRGNNVIAVRVANIGRNSRWYSGSGIYRHVRLTFTAPVHIAQWGVQVSAASASAERASLKVQTTLVNRSGGEGEFGLKVNLFSPSGKHIATVQSSTHIDEGSNTTVTQHLAVTAPLLWSPEKPRLYMLKVYLLDGSKKIDSITIKTGIRSIAFTTGGFMLNGKRTILKGGCVHHDNGPLGAAAFDDAEVRKLQILKASGYNAIRTSHNPPSQSFLNICDSLGLMVIDEFFDEWEEPKLFTDSFAYHHFFKKWWKNDVDAAMLRDRNHPSVILWSIGNEIHERADSNGIRIAKMLVDEVHRMDSSRPVTEAVCYFWDHEGRPWDSTRFAFAPLDVAGYNYEWYEYESDHKKYPGRIMAGTESYPMEMLENFTVSEKLPYVTGDFIWTAMDYIGETGIGHSKLQPASELNDNTMLNPWPWYNAWCGDIDITGFKKPQSYYRDIVWRLKPVEMLVHAPVPAGMKEKVSGWGWPDEAHSWTWPGQEGKLMQVRVFSRSPLVRLELNGKIMGEKKIPADSIAAVFEIPYMPGILKAIAIENGKPAGTVTLTTTGKAASLHLSTASKKIKAGRNSLSYITVEIHDNKGRVVMNDDHAVTFTLTGPGEVAGVGNANPADMSSFKQPVKTTFKGRCIVIIRSKGIPGKITLQASAAGLPVTHISIEAK
ncbi:MAG TPA: glycoside hydrolase family 2 TIM barrel-domain containing protein [Chitinophagaceae bacterium]|nr:glycoside hydrolase family 2 TIM barrel-domain containing protein [Chitinophagaceae bacterium]